MRKQFFSGLAGGVLLALAGGAARADYALVIGINEYANAPQNNLAGCVNDAKTMAAALQKYGFKKVVLLADKQATQAGILQALNDAQRQNDAKQRFVFYFAGHGAIKAGSLVTNDAATDNDFKDIDKDTLYRAVKAVPAKSRTIILDSCYSGAMSRAFGNRGKTRFFTRKQSGGVSKAWIETLANAQDDNQNVGIGSDICYYTAAQGGQQSNEDCFENGSHGLFTYFLSKRLSGAMTRWGDLDAAVGGDVSLYALKELERTQNPTLSSKFGKVGLFDSPDAAPVISAPDKQDKKSLWDVFNGKNVDARRLSLTLRVESDMKPNQVGLDTETEISFKAHTGAKGYLAILEYGTSGVIYLRFPASAALEDARVTANQDVFIPGPDANGDLSVFRPNAPGQEQARAILFTSAKQAAAFLKHWVKGANDKNKEVTAESASKDFEVVPAPLEPFYTSDLHLDIVAGTGAGQADAK